ncbi:CRISPR-associated ring nuclease Csm6 [Pseudoalteromonas rubra]|uniref:CRISPR-associated ring nuclease Csm6 n=1 Tax=Pseudoalteromonas rubra TaxID=43658 RepID=UPI0013DE00A6|nr:CRISPR-associated ring nuclease Csm6 [Pseudoalteromonas rubra]
MKQLLLVVADTNIKLIAQTLSALRHRGQHIDTLKVITTLRGYHALHEAASDGALAEQLQLGPVEFNLADIQVISDEHGQAMSEPTTAAQHDAMADFITRAIQCECTIASQQVHASLSGARKTLTFFMGYAMSLFARLGDTLSHILPGNTGDPAPALVTIPFVRMRDELPAALLDQHSSYQDVVQSLNTVKNAHQLVLAPQTHSVQLGELITRLRPIDLTFYIWFIKQQIQQQGSVRAPIRNQPEPEYANTFIAEYRTLVDWLRADEVEAELRAKTFCHDTGFGMDANFFSERKSRIKRSFLSGFGKQLSEQIAITLCAKQGHHRLYKVPLSLSRITTQS